ncbi:endonuclease III domain-containing protein [Ferrimonas marina]|uniref:DNA-3-methyladenine glycosylase III n=1 Tax=Ferrimonas marina TaxID=299255 RepID=A0A1M5MKG9_9GAMM|nr:endonuclease [Ferrimonas marina]SHG77725.1 DNA-3-methyladenine glycosylase III [Ferrimonas marina]
MPYPSDDPTLIQSVFSDLSDHFGPFVWWLDQPPLSILLGAVLVQNTNWRNADKAMANLGEHFSAEGVARLPIEELAQRIRPSGYYNQKAAKLKALMSWYQSYDYDIELARQQPKAQLRQELLAIKGVGQETADAILVYALHKPSFVIDAYARRLFSRNGLAVPKRYGAFQQLIEQAVPNDYQTHAYFHGLIVEHGQAFCRPRPQCQQCPLRANCPDAQLATSPAQ